MTRRVEAAQPLAPSSHPHGPMPRRSVLAALLLGFGAAACVPPEDRPDGGGGDGSMLTASARVVLPSEPLEDGDVAIDTFTLRVASLRLVSDRGGALDPVRADVGSLDLAAEQSVEFASVPPASYSAAVLVLDGAARVLEIDAEDATIGRMHIVYGTRVEWTARCGSVVPVGVGETLELRIEVELGTAWDALRAADLPPAAGGVVTIDETTAPAAVAEFVRLVGEQLGAECREDGA